MEITDDPSNWVIKKLGKTEKTRSSDADGTAESSAVQSGSRLDQILFIDDSDSIDEEVTNASHYYNNSATVGNDKKHQSQNDSMDDITNNNELCLTLVAGPVVAITREERRQLLKRVDSLHDEPNVCENTRAQQLDQPDHEIKDLSYEDVHQQTSTIAEKTMLPEEIGQSIKKQTLPNKNKEITTRKPSFLESILHTRKKPQKSESVPPPAQTTRKRIKRLSECSAESTPLGGYNGFELEEDKDSDLETTKSIKTNMLDNNIDSSQFSVNTKLHHVPLSEITNSNENICELKTDLLSSQTNPKKRDTDSCILNGLDLAETAVNLAQAKMAQENETPVVNTTSSLKQKVAANIHLSKILHKDLQHKSSKTASALNPKKKKVPTATLR